MNRAPALMRMRDLLQIQKLEQRLLLYGDDPHHVEVLVEEASLELFGTRPSDHVFEFPAEYSYYRDFSPERRRIDKMYREHEDKYLAGQQPTYDTMMGVLALMGLDFSDERGQPLRCTKHLARVAEAAATGMAGKLPDREAAVLEKVRGRADSGPRGVLGEEAEGTPVAGRSMWADSLLAIDSGVVFCICSRAG